MENPGKSWKNWLSWKVMENSWNYRNFEKVMEKSWNFRKTKKKALFAIKWVVRTAVRGVWRLL